MIPYTTAVVLAALTTGTPSVEPLCDIPATEASQEAADEYLYQRYLLTPKVDGRWGKEQDFTHKDFDAAARRGMTLKQYVILGARPRLRMSLYKMCKAAEAEGIECGITSCFRDDPRQAAATGGMLARVGYSRHGGSKVTRGWGDGQACDVVALGAVYEDAMGLAYDRRDQLRKSVRLWQLIDARGNEFDKLVRPYGNRDAMHVSMRDSNEHVATRSAKKSKLAKHKAGKKTRLAKYKKHRHGKKTRVAMH